MSKKVTGKCAGCDEIKTVTVPDNYIPSLITSDNKPLIACDDCIKKELEAERKSLEDYEEISIKRPFDWEAWEN